MQYSPEEDDTATLVTDTDIGLGNYFDSAGCGPELLRIPQLPLLPGCRREWLVPRRRVLSVHVV